MQPDIRDITSIDHHDVIGLNFIHSDCKYLFRRHFRQGLRSHILEVLDRKDIEKERCGVYDGGTLLFPKARPRKVLRIFRTRFNNLEQAMQEIRRVKMTESYLTPECIAQSVEIIVEYHLGNQKSILLCGLQDYVAGVVFDPWTLLTGAAFLSSLYDSLMGISDPPLIKRKKWLSLVRGNGEQFIANTKKMITEASLIPDLAGVGNVLVTSSGSFRLVDINNISPVIFDDTIRLDDRNYPVSDKSIEALALMEEKLLDGQTSDPLYERFLSDVRRRKVREREKKFRAINVDGEGIPST